MKLYYTFTGDFDRNLWDYKEQEYEYEVDTRDAVDALLEGFTVDELFNDFMKYIYPEENEYNKKVLTSWHITKDTKKFPKEMYENEDEVKEFFEEFFDSWVYNDNKNLWKYADYLKDYFEEVAEEEFRYNYF